MPSLFDPINAILIAAAVFIAWRFFGVLGHRDGADRAPPRIVVPPQQKQKPADGKDGGTSRQPEPEVLDPVWKGFATEGTALAKGLEALAAASPGFTVTSFLTGAKQAYEMILEAFAKGDRQALKPLLSKDVMDGFAAAITSREHDGRRMVFKFVGIKSATLTQAAIEGKRAQLTVLFKADMISATMGTGDAIIEGDPRQIREITDEWTFERDTSSRDPNWKLIGTADGTA